METSLIERTQPREINYEILEKVLAEGCGGRLSARERVEYYDFLCRSIGLNPLTRPFEYIIIQGKLTLYARKDATEQIRRNNGISITKVEKEWNTDKGLYIVTAYAIDQVGRTDASTGVVFVKNMTGKDLANGLMTAETKAKRRVTLSIAGLGFLDETEVETVTGAKIVRIDESGEIVSGTTTVVSQKNGIVENGNRPATAT